MTYHVLCSIKDCKAKRDYKGTTFDDCLDQAKDEGWKMAANTKLTCPTCNKQ